MNSSRLAQLTSRLMDELDSGFVEDAKVGEVSVIVEVQHTDGDQKESTIVLTSTDSREWVQRALLCEGLMALECVEEES